MPSIDHSTPGSSGPTLCRDATVIDCIQALQMPVANLRLEAARTLVRLASNSRLKEPLLAALADEDDQVRLVALSVMGRFDDERTLRKVLSMLSDDNPDIRAHAATALGEMGRQEATLPLLKLIFDPDMEVHLAAAEALQKLDDERTIKLLKTAIKEGASLQVRHRASLALQLMGVMHDRVLVNNPTLATLQRESESFPGTESLDRLFGTRSEGPIERPSTGDLKQHINTLLDWNGRFQRPASDTPHDPDWDPYRRSDQYHYLDPHHTAALPRRRLRA